MKALGKFSNKGIRDKWHYVILISIFLYFGVKGVILCFNLQPGILPDEKAHIGLIDKYLEKPLYTIILDPADFVASPAGTISQDRFLYHRIVSYVVIVLGFIENYYLILRLLSLFFSVLTVVLFYRIAKILLDESWLVLVSIFLFTNIIMFTLMSCAISYDALANLIGASLIFQFALYCKEEKLVRLVRIVILSLVGFFVKPSILPLSIIVFVLAVTYGVKLGFLSSRVSLLAGKLRKNRFDIVLLASLSVVFVLHRVYIFQRYHATSYVNCYDVYSVDECKSTNSMVVGYEKIRLKNLGKPRVQLVAYFDNWVDTILRKSFGVTAHKSIPIPESGYSALKILFALSIIGLLRMNWSRLDSFLILIPLLYFSFLIFIFNYPHYLKFGHMSATVQGRYLFPVLSIIIIYFIKGLLRLGSSRPMKNLLISIAVSLFFVLDFPALMLGSEKGKILLAQAGENSSIALSRDFDISTRYCGCRSYVDYVGGQNIKNDTAVFVHPSKESITITGWSYDMVKEDAFEELLFSINDETFYHGQYGRPRPDVARVFKNNSIQNVGFVLNIDSIGTLDDTFYVKLYGQIDSGQLVDLNRKIVINRSSVK